MKGTGEVQEEGLGLSGGMVWGGISLLEDVEVSMGPDAPLENANDCILYDVFVLWFFGEGINSHGIPK